MRTGPKLLLGAAGGIALVTVASRAVGAVRVAVLPRTLGTPDSMLAQFDFWDRRYEGRRLFSGLLGTFFLVLVAVGGGVVNARFGGSAVPYGALVVAPALMVAAIILFMGAVSGAHLNPAVTIALAAFRGFSWKKVLPYSVAQFLGAFLAALVVRWNYTEALNKVDPGLTIKTQGVFSTLPGNGSMDLGVDMWGGFRDQIIGTAILMFVILAITVAISLASPKGQALRALQNAEKYSYRYSKLPEDADPAERERAAALMDRWTARAEAVAR